MKAGSCRAISGLICIVEERIKVAIQVICRSVRAYVDEALRIAVLAHHWAGRVYPKLPLQPT